MLTNGAFWGVMLGLAVVVAIVYFTRWTQPALNWLMGHRMVVTLAFSMALVGFVAALQPQQFGVILFKLALATLAAVVGYWIDREAFGELRPSWFLVSRSDDDPEPKLGMYIRHPQVLAAVMIRRAIIMAALVLGVCWGA